MHKVPLLLILFLLAATIAPAQQGYNIPITIKPYKNAYLYLGYHYGKRKALADSAKLDENGKGTFKGTKPLGGGIYFITSPRKEILFELLIDKEQSFSIEADSATIPSGLKFINSKENTLFKDYTLQINKTGQEGQALMLGLNNTTDPAEQQRIRNQVQEVNKFILNFRDSIEKKNPTSFLAALIRAMKEPVIPPADKHPGGKYDSNYAFRYFKKHYWDGISFTDDRLIRTPIFEAKLDKYFKDLVAPDPDSIFREADYMLIMSRTNAEMYKYLMVHFVQKYINPEYMGYDKVFVRLYEKYINTGQAEFFTEQYKKHMSDRFYSILANLIGEPASELNMSDTSGKPLPLSKVNGDFIVICFWDPACGHCKEVVPKVDSIFQANWKQHNVKLYGVMVEGGKDNWTKFIRDNNLKDWIHVYQTDDQKNADIASGKPLYRQLYDVYQTPVLYLLDSKKRIIAKKVSHQQIDDIMKLKRQQPSSN